MQTYIDITNEVLREMCVIPAPSHFEDKRVEYCLKKLKTLGIEASADEAKNVIIEFPCADTTDTVVIEGHTDVVFPDTTPLPLSEDEENIYNPGCGDDTVAVAMLIAAVKKIKDENKVPKMNVVIVLNSCEEGLGNLKGTKAIFDKYGKNVSEFITFDGRYPAIVDTSVGSHRYKVTVKTEGGHSFNNFGNENAARVLAEGIRMIYGIKLPDFEGKTTYNVGSVSGGTSVNTIIQEATMLCEYRSNNHDSLLYMKQRFADIFDEMRKFATVEVEVVGERPCMVGVDPVAQQKLNDKCAEILKKCTGLDAVFESGSTDCNIPHSLGIPAVCVGNYTGGGAHTREEWLEKKSIPTGLNIVTEIIERYFN